MSGIVEFIIKMQDGLTAPLSKISKNSTTANNALQKLAESNKLLKGMTDRSGRSVNDLERRINNLKEYRNILPLSAEKQIRGINSEINKLTTTMTKMQTMNGNKVKVWAKDAFAQIPPLITNPITIAAMAVGAAFNQGMKNSKEKLDFQLLVGNNTGADLFKGLKKMKPIIGEEAFVGGKQLVNAGMEVEKVTDTVERLTAVSQGDAGKFNALTTAFAQIQREGKLTEGTLQTLTLNGFKPLTILQQRFGGSTDYWQKKLADGTITMDNLNKALADSTDKGGQFGDVLDRLNASPTGMWNKLIYGATTIAGKFGELLMPIATKVLGLLTTGFEYLNIGVDYTIKLFSDLWKWAGDNADILTALGGAVLGGVVAYKAFQAYQTISYMWMMRDTIATTLLATVKGGLTAATAGLTIAQNSLNAAFLASPIGWIVGGIALVVGGVILAWNKFEGFRKVIYGLWEVFKEVFVGIGKLFGQIFGPIGEAIGYFIQGDYGKIGGALSKITTKGAFDGVEGAYARSEAKGAASWAASQKKKNEKTATEKQFGTDESQQADYFKSMTDTLKNKDEKSAKVNDGINAISGGGVKNITVSVGTMVKDLTFHIVGGTKEMAHELERAIEEAMVRAIASASNR